MNTRFYIRPSMDVPNCYNVYDRETTNQWGKDYCVDSHITYEEAVRLCDYLNSGKVTPENPYPAGVLSYADDTDTTQAANDAAGEAAYNEVVEEPTGYMRPCEDCNGSGTEPHPYFDGVRHCSSCDGTGIHQADESEAPSYESLLKEIATLRQQLADAQAENARLKAGVAEIKLQKYDVKEKFGLFYVTAPDKRVLTTGYADSKLLALICALLNQEVKPLTEQNQALEKQLADAQAENAELKQMLSRREAFVYRIRAAETFEAVRELLQEDHLRGLAEMFDLEFNPQPAPVPVADAPTTPARMRVKWGERGFSSGSYEVISTNAAKQAYVLNISTDTSKPMPKLVKMADCQPVN